MKRSFRISLRYLLAAMALLLAFGVADPVHADPDDPGEDPPESSSEEVCEHEFGGPYLQSEAGHWQLCTKCNEAGPVNQHTFSGRPSSVDDEVHRDVCTECGYPKEEAHTFEWHFDEESHWKICSKCGNRSEPSPHRPDREEATEEDPVLCLDCGYEIDKAKKRHTIKLAQDDNDKYADFANEDDYLHNVKMYSALEGEEVEIIIHDPEAPSVYVVGTLYFTNFEGEELDEIEVDGNTSIYYIMPDDDVIVRLEMEIDEDKVEASKEEESRSIEESIALESSIEESIAEAKRFKFGSYRVETDVSGVTPPKNFIRANDVSNFDRTVGCFYSTDYRIFVYYASEDGKEYDYYVLDRIGNDLIPFVTFPGTGSTSYVVSAPASEKDIPGIFRQETQITLTFASGMGAVTVPAFLVVDPDGDTLTLLYLNDDLGNQQFYTYDRSHGTAELIEYNRYEERKKTGETEKEGNIIITPSSEEAKEEKTGKTELSRGVIWLIIVGVIVVLLAASLITVFIMSKQQEAKERELDEEDDEDEIEPEPKEETETVSPLEEDEEVPETFDTTLYKNPDPDDMNSGKEAADFDFENAFPVAGGVIGKAAAETAEGQEEAEKVVDFESGKEEETLAEAEMIIDFEEIDAGETTDKKE